jgi:hypothetical protein
MSTGHFEEADPVHELHGHLDQTLRVAMAGGLQVAHVRGQRELDERARLERQGDREARELLRRRQADKTMAMALWRRANSNEWWDQATPDQVARVYEAAFLYAGTDPDAADAMVRIDKELENRYGLATDEGTGMVHSTTRDVLGRDAVGAAMAGAEEAIVANEARWGEWRAALGPDVADKVLTSPAWPGLETRLTELDRQGINSVKALGDAVQLRDLDGAKDVARVLKFRMSPSALKAKDKGMGVEAEGLERARLVNDTVAAAKTPERPTAPSRASKTAGAAEEAQAARRRRADRERDAGQER